MNVSAYNKSEDSKEMTKKIKKVVTFLTAVAYNVNVVAKVIGQMMWGSEPQNLTR